MEVWVSNHHFPRLNFTKNLLESALSLKHKEWTRPSLGGGTEFRLDWINLSPIHRNLGIS